MAAPAMEASAEGRNTEILAGNLACFHKNRVKNQSKAQHPVAKRLKTFENIRKRSKTFKNYCEAFENV